MYRKAIIALSVCLCVTAAYAASPVGWRTDGTGRYPAAEPATKWSPDANVIWKTETPGWSNATPIIVNDRIFICAEPDTLLCVSLADGKMLWRRSAAYESLLTAEQLAEHAENEKKAAPLRKKLEVLSKAFRQVRQALRKSPKDAGLKEKSEQLKKEIDALKKRLEPLAKYKRPPTHGCNGYSSATPTSDGRFVYVVFGTGVAACYDLEGNRRWARFVEKSREGYGPSASPLLVGDRLIVHIRGVAALDSKTGKTLWQVESAHAWGSPVLARIDNADVIVTASGDLIRADDGRALAKKVSPLVYCSPVLHEGAAYFIQHGGKAVRLPAKADGSAEPQTLWETKPHKDRYYASPVYHDGLLYAITRYNIFSVIDAADGKVVYSRKLDLGKGTVFSSVTFAGGHLFISSDNGTTIVIEPGREYKEVAKNKLEPVRSSPVFLGGRMYVRGLKHLYCIGERPAAEE